MKTKLMNEKEIEYPSKINLIMHGNYKFRVWNKKDKKMHYQGGLIMIENKIGTPQMIPMLRIPRQDEEGKFIYQGDILTAQDDYGNYSEIFVESEDGEEADYQPNGKYLVARSDFGNVSLKKEDGTWIDLDYNPFTDNGAKFWILGNICENQELMPELSIKDI